MNKFSVLLKCRIKKDSKLNLINDCLKQNLENILMNHNEKMTQNYLLLIKELSKQPDKTKFDFKDYYNQTLKHFLKLNNLFESEENSFLFAIEVIFFFNLSFFRTFFN